MSNLRAIEIKAFVQGSIIECFINDAYAFSCRAYNLPRGRISLTAEGGAVQVLGLSVATDREPAAAATGP